MRGKHRILKKDPRIKVIKDALKKIPNFDKDFIGPHQKIQIDQKILQEIFFDRNDIPNFTLEEMRKLDLSSIDFTHKKMINRNYSYTNIVFDPRKVMGKLLLGTNLEGINLSKKHFTEVDIRGTNLKNTGAKINLKTIKYNSIEDTNLEGCTIIGEKQKTLKK